MDTREVQDENNITWTCVQAFTGTSGVALKKAAKMAETENGEVEVVCTPSEALRLYDSSWTQTGATPSVIRNF